MNLGNYSKRRRWRSKKAVSSGVFSAVVIILIIIAAAGYGLYATNSGNAPATTKTITSTMEATTTAPGGAVSTTTLTTGTMNVLKSGGFMNSTLVTFGYSQNYTCTPAISSFGFNSTEATNAEAMTGCEVGGPVTALQYPRLF